MKDRDGGSLEPGDLISVACRVERVEGEHLIVRTLENGPDGQPTTIALCGTQVKLSEASGGAGGEPGQQARRGGQEEDDATQWRRPEDEAKPGGRPDDDRHDD